MALIYYQHKIFHNGISTYKVFDGFQRKMKQSSLDNLLKRNYYTDELGQEVEIKLNDASNPCEKIKQYVISESISKKIKKQCSKLVYYSGTRHFESKKSGKYNFKVAFITLTAPEMFTTQEINEAFKHFQDYLYRTANCQYVYKKEVGYKSGKFHIHLLINNFIPYYIIRDKWQKLLMNQRNEWSKDANGKPTTTHYRIELPRSKKLVASYISKYMSKAGELFENVGKLWGCSEGLKNCKEDTYIENELNAESLLLLSNSCKLFLTDYSSFIAVDPLRLRNLMPEIYELFDKQFRRFAEILTLPQKFNYV